MAGGVAQAVSFEVIVLGASGTFPAPGSACSGFLLRSGGRDVWLDAGPGTFANLQRHADYHALRGVVLTHVHLDHVLDVYPLYYALRYAPGSPGPLGIEVHGPAGAGEYLAGMVTGGDFDGYLAFRTAAAGQEAEIGGFRFRFARTRHPVETLAVRVEAERRVFAYTADTGFSEAVVDLARGADVLVAEASFQEPVADMGDVHMTAEEAGETAARAGVGRLVLTHIPPGLDPEVSRALASRRFGGEISLAADGLKIIV